jgi:hypothetical protein
MRYSPCWGVGRSRTVSGCSSETGTPAANIRSTTSAARAGSSSKPLRSTPICPSGLIGISRPPGVRHNDQPGCVHNIR